MTSAMRFLISGSVQGVFFRASTRAEAVRLGLRGYAINRADGRVEVLVVGEAGNIAELAEWLYDGPPRAKVLEVESVPADVAELSGRKGFSCG